MTDPAGAPAVANSDADLLLGERTGNDDRRPEREAPRSLPSEGRTGNNFDFIRFFFATLVILSHSYPLTRGNNNTEPLMRFSDQETMGGVSVDMFFVLSGYLIARSWQTSKGSSEFVTKRLKRIVPAFFVVNLLTFFVLAPAVARAGSTLYSRQRVRSFILSDLLQLRGTNVMPGVFTDLPFPQSLNGSLWSISYEAWCYVGILLLGLMGILGRRHVVLGLFGAALLVSAVFHFRHLQPDAYFPSSIVGAPSLWARLLPYYLIGTVFYLYRDRIAFRDNTAAMAFVLLIVACFVPFGLGLGLPTCGAYLIFWFAQTTRIRLHNWARFGDFSYGIYLYAFPIEQLLVHRIPSLRPWTLFLTATALTIPCAAVSWHLVEKHFLRRSNRPDPIVRQAYLIP